MDHGMKTYRMEVHIHAFSISTFQGEWSASKYRSLKPCGKSRVYKINRGLASLYRLSGCEEDTTEFNIHGSVHRRLLSRNTNKMQLCNKIYYSKVYWRLNMFRGAHRSSWGALNCICSLWFICPCGDRPLPSLSGKLIHSSISHSALATVGHHMSI